MFSGEHEIDSLKHLVRPKDSFNQCDLSQNTGLSLATTSAIVNRPTGEGRTSVSKSSIRFVECRVVFDLRTTHSAMSDIFFLGACPTVTAGQIALETIGTVLRDHDAAGSA